MKVVFYGNRKGNFVDKTIRWWTSSFKEKLNGAWRDSYSHSEILFSDGMMFSASQYENITRFKQHSYSNHWVYVDLEASPKEEEIVRSFCEKVAGAKYDYWGILGYVFGTPHKQSHWFCSEVNTAALQRIGLLKNLKPHKTSPNALYLKLKELK